MVTLGALSLLTIGARLSAAEPLRPPVPVVRPPAAATPPARTVRVATARVVPASPRASAARITSARPPAARDTARRAEPARTSRPAARQAARPVGRVAARPERAPDPAPAASGPSVILAALDAAARASGVEHEALAAMAWRESRFDPRARNPASSARGLMQFTEDAWLEAVRDHGAAHGLARQAARLSTNPETGAISARTPLERERLLARRHEPALAAALAGARTAAARPGWKPRSAGRWRRPTSMPCTCWARPAPAGS
jgi:soluble lytic murein transglycosylase-like protein